MFVSIALSLLLRYDPKTLHLECDRALILTSAEIAGRMGSEKLRSLPYIHLRSRFGLFELGDRLIEFIIEIESLLHATGTLI